MFKESVPSVFTRSKWTTVQSLRNFYDISFKGHTLYARLEIVQRINNIFLAIKQLKVAWVANTARYSTKKAFHKLIQNLRI